MKIGFWLSFASVAYIYVGYLAAAFLLASMLRRDVKRGDRKPAVTIITAAFNEEREIGSTIINKLSQDYPHDRLNMIVVSDGSTDGTDDIVRKLAGRYPGRLTVLRQEPRQGKTQALNMAVAHASGQILVFSDANSIYAHDAIDMLVRNFADPSVGYVTGRMIYTNPEGSAFGEECNSYIQYENTVRSLETRLGSVVGVAGGIDAVRRELYVSMTSDQLPDLVLPLSVVERGKRVVYEPDALLYEPAVSRAHDELRMRVRVTLRAIWALYDKKNLLNPLRFPLYAWQLLSHKVLRYAAFLFLLGTFLFNALLASGEQSFYRWFLALQLVGYSTAVLGHLLRRFHIRASKLMAPYYFVVLNAACVLAFWKFLTGQKMVLWKPRAGAVSQGQS